MPSEDYLNRYFDLKIVENYKSLNIQSETLFPWQVDCLEQLFAKQQEYFPYNLVFSFPTGSGKSLIADYMAITFLDSTVETKKKCFYVVPYVALGAEKTRYYERLFHETSYQLVSMYGEVDTRPINHEGDSELYIVTIEKCNSIVNKLIEEGKQDSIGLVLIDEFHIISEPIRGSVLEMLICKLKFVSQANFVVFSATLPDMEILREWFSYKKGEEIVPAEFFLTDKRVIEIQECQYSDSEILNITLSKRLTVPKELDVRVFITASFFPTLVFCSSKAETEATAKFFADKEIQSPTRIRKVDEQQQHIQQKREFLIERLKTTPFGLDPKLAECIRQGIAFHHAGITTEERTLIEQAYIEETIDILCCTTTLAAGVNLPAQSILCEKMQTGNEKLTVTNYKQMIGRCGRPNFKEQKGMSFFRVNNVNDKRLFDRLSKGVIPSIESKIIENSSLKRAILEIITMGLARDAQAIFEFIKLSLFAKTCSNQDVEKVVENITNELLKDNFLQNQGTCETTLKAKALYSLGLPLNEGLNIYTNLVQMRTQLNLESDIHLLFPIVTCIGDSFLSIETAKSILFSSQYTKFNVDILRRHGASEIIKEKASQFLPLSKPERDMLIRLAATYLVSDAVNESPLNDVALKYKVERGKIQSLLEKTCKYAHLVSLMCNELNWWALHKIYSHLCLRLRYSVREELMDLMQITSLNPKLARTLYKEGLTTLDIIAQQKLDTIVKVLASAQQYSDTISTRMNADLFDRATKIIAEARKIAQIESSNGTPSNNSPAKLLPSPARVSPNFKSKSSTSSKFTPKSLKSPNRKRIEYDNKENIVVDTTPPSKIQKIDEIYNQFSFEEALDFCDEGLPVIEKHGHFILQFVETAPQFEVFLSTVSNWPHYSIVLDIEEKTVPGKIIEHTRVESNTISVKFNGIAFCNPTDIEAVFKDKRELLNKKWETYYVCINNSPDRIAQLKTLLEDKIKGKLAYRIKDIIRKLKYFDIQLGGPLFDPLVAHWMDYAETKEDNENAKKNMKNKEASLAEIFTSAFRDNKMKEDFKLNQHRLYTSVAIYQVICHFVFYGSLKQKNIDASYKENEMPLMPLLAEMEFYGLSLDTHAFEQLEKEISRMKKTYIVKICSCILEVDQSYDTTNIETKITGKSDELSDILFGILKCESAFKKPRQGKTDKYLTNKTVLLSLNHPIGKYIYQYRLLGHILNDILELKKYRKRRSENGDMKIYYKYQVTTSATGRLCSTEANLQNLVKEKTFDDLSSDGTIVKFNIRDSIITKDDFVLVSFDYKQIEMRILTHFSQDEQLMNIFQQQNQDIFAIIAQTIFKQQIVDKFTRDKTKQLCYAIIYGMSPKTLAKTLEIDEYEAKQLFEQLFATFPKLKQYISEIPTQVEQNGWYVTTILGRRRYIPALHSTDIKTRRLGERIAVNSRIQGSAADIVKQAMRKVETLVIANAKEHVKMLLQIHDELLFEIRISMFNQIIWQIKQCMEFADDPNIDVPLPVEISVGKSWGSLKQMSQENIMDCKIDTFDVEPFCAKL